MVRIIENNRAQLERLCRRYCVKCLEVFGSAAREADFAQTSDLDFLVEFLPLSPVEHKDAYFGLLEALRNLFNRPVDLLETDAIDNPYLLESINQNRVRLYAA